MIKVSYGLIGDLELELWEYNCYSVVELYRPCGSSLLVWRLVRVWYDLKTSFLCVHGPTQNTLWSDKKNN